MSTLSSQHKLTRFGLKSTPARRAVLDIIGKKNRPLDVTEINVNLHKRQFRIDRVTVYRTLDRLVKHNLIKRIEFHEGKFRYEKVGEDHHHLVCEKCGRISDIGRCPVVTLEKSIYSLQHFLVKRHALEFFGLCKNCH